VKKKPKRHYFVDKDALTKVGICIRNQRINKKLSIEKLTLECDMDYSQLSRMELGQVNFSISYLFKVAASLGISPKDLIP
jgi:transcriptional regulator with XRE-family HTH domain